MPPLRRRETLSYVAQNAIIEMSTIRAITAVQGSNLAPPLQGSKLFWLHDDAVTGAAAAATACGSRHINGTLAVIAGPSDDTAVQLLLAKLPAGGAAWLGPRRNATGARCVAMDAHRSLSPHWQCWKITAEAVSEASWTGGIHHAHCSPPGGAFFNPNGSPTNGSLAWCSGEPNDAGNNCTLGLQTCPGGSKAGAQDAACSGTSSYRFICSQPEGSCVGEQAVFSACSLRYNKIWLHVDKWMNASEASTFCRRGNCLQTDGPAVQALPPCCDTIYRGCHVQGPSTATVLIGPTTLLQIHLWAVNGDAWPGVRQL